MFRIKIISTPTMIDKLRTQGPGLIAALTQRMNLLMFKLQSKIVGEEIPKFFKTNVEIGETVRAIPARVEGTVIKGEVQAGGVGTTKETLGGPHAGELVDYAAVQEAGVAHAWLIQPVLFANAWAVQAKAGPRFGKDNLRVRVVTGLPKALAFMLNGKQMILRSVTHPGLKERPFMRQGLADMQEQIVTELSETFTGFLQ